MYRKDDRKEWSGDNSCALLVSAFIQEGSKCKIEMDEVKLDVTDNLYENDTAMLREQMDDYASKIYTVWGVMQLELLTINVCSYYSVRFAEKGS
jgi:hypothetical protein